MADNKQNPESGDTQQQQTENASANEQQNTSGSSNNKTLKIVLIVVGVLIILGILVTVLAGFLFQKAAEGVFDAATDSDVEVSEEGVNVETDEGSFSFQAELPEDFPEEVPLFEPAEVQSSSSQQRGAEEASYTATLATEAAQEEVVDFYERELESDGWQTTSTSTFNNRVHYEAERGDDMNLQVVIAAASREADGVSITLTAVES